MSPYLGKKPKVVPPKIKKIKKTRKPRYYLLRRQPKAISPKVYFPPVPKPVKRPKLRIHKYRTRSKDPFMYHYEQSGPDGRIYYLDDHIAYAEVMSDYTVKPGNMTILKTPAHHMVGSFSGDRNPSSPRETWKFYGNYFWINPGSTTNCWTSFVGLLKHKKLPTSNQADLMTAFAELDDSIAMLARPSKPSYGSVKWGWMPLISDINAANDAAAAVKASFLDGNRRSNRYNATHTINKNSVDVVRNEHVYFHKWEVKVKHVGMISYENDILAFYDYMGYHPSPKLFWDLVPLSFAIDYILPIGDMLKALTPSKGWVRSANFTGWQVITATVTEICKSYPSWSSGPKVACSQTYVTRTYLHGSVLEQKTIPRSPSLKTPSLEQIFDIAYLTEAFFNRTKKILSPHVYRKRK